MDKKRGGEGGKKKTKEERMGKREKTNRQETRKKKRKHAEARRSAMKKRSLQAPHTEARAPYAQTKPTGPNRRKGAKGRLQSALGANAKAGPFRIPARRAEGKAARRGRLATNPTAGTQRAARSGQCGASGSKTADGPQAVVGIETFVEPDPPRPCSLAPLVVIVRLPASAGALIGVAGGDVAGEPVFGEAELSPAVAPTQAGAGVLRRGPNFAHCMAGDGRAAAVAPDRARAAAP